MRDQLAVDKLSLDRVPIDASKFTQFDGLERTDDLEVLFETLSSVKDINGNSACITPLVLMANPDFKAIRANGFEQYEYEGISTTFSKYNEPGLLELWKGMGVKEKLFYPQFHGREHINYRRWMKAIRRKDSMAQKAFEQESILGIRLEKTSQQDNYMAAFEAINDIEQEYINKGVQTGLNEFEKLFGFRSISAIPSQSIISENSIKALKANGVNYLQCGQHFLPSSASLQKRDYLWGHQDKHGMTYWRRNVNFEPYTDRDKDHVDEAMAEIALAFRFRKPAVISSHRINYTSRITSSLRDQSLKQLKTLLNKIVDRWPDVQFINSEDLARNINSRKF